MDDSGGLLCHRRRRSGERIRLKRIRKTRKGQRWGGGKAERLTDRSARDIAAGLGSTTDEFAEREMRALGEIEEVGTSGMRTSGSETGNEAKGAEVK